MNKISLKNIFSFEKTPLNIITAIIIAALLVAFAAGLVNLLINGHHAYNVGRSHPWGLMLATYLFLLICCTGLCIVSSFGHVFGVKEFNLIGNRAVLGAIVAMLAGFAVIALEIGHPFTMILYNVVSPGLASAIWWMGVLYVVYIVLISLEFFFLNIKNDHKTSKIFGILGLFFGISANSNMGSIFGLLVAREAVSGFYYPAQFILSSIVSGAFIVFVMYGFRYKLEFPHEIKIMLIKLAKVLGILIAIFIFIEFWRIFISLYENTAEKSGVVLHAISKPTFWFAELFLVLLIPFFTVLLSKAQAIKQLVFVSFFGLIGLFFMRYNLIRDTLTYPMDTMKRSEYEIEPTLIEYFPSVTEFCLALGGIGLALFLYFVANKVFNLDK